MSHFIASNTNSSDLTLPMPAQLLLTPTITTAISHLETRIARVKNRSPLEPVTILLPTAGVIRDLRSKLGDSMGVRMFSFYQLAHAVLDEAGIPIHELNETAIRRLIGHILRDMAGEERLTSFYPVREKPGFVEVLLSWVREMKSQGIFLEKVQKVAEQSGSARDLQLAEFYSHYQTFMQARDYSDTDGLLWVAAEALEEHTSLFCSSGPLFVLGFDQFTPVQLRILKQFIHRFNVFNIYLLWDEDRSQDSLALARLRSTRDVLSADLPLTTNTLPQPFARNPSLTFLHQSIFESVEKQPVEAGSIHLVEAPSREAEVRRTLREIKRLLLEGVSPAEISILSSNPGAYLSIIRTVATEYSVPIEYQRPLMNIPVVAALVNLLQLAPDFSWQATFETLRSPYIQQPWLTAEQIDLLDQLSRERPVIGGPDQWLYAFQPLQADAREVEDEDWEPLPLVAQLPPEELSAIEEGLSAFFDHLTPAETASYRDFTWWVQTSFIGLFPEAKGELTQTPEPSPSLAILACCQNSPFPRRDLSALTQVMSAMRAVLFSAELVPNDRLVPWETYRDDLISLLSFMHLPPDSQEAKVRFAPLADGRARVVDHLFILGLSEGEFPTPAPVDVFYARREREKHDLPLLRYTPANEASLWWQVLGNVRQRLTLLRPYIDDNGAPWQPSPYWDAVRDCFSGLEREQIPIAVHPTFENAANQNELLVATAQTGAQISVEPLEERWHYVQQAEQVMRQRRSYLPPGNYEGILGAEGIKDELAHTYSPRHVWSASRLNRYANCPYGFFAEHVLKLEARPDPEEGLDAMGRGSLLHAVLEHLYRQLTTTALPMTIANLETVLHLLEDSCGAIFPRAPQRFGFRPGALWRHEQAELRRQLRVLVTWECEQNGDSVRFEPFLQEAGFGIGLRKVAPILVVDTGEVSFRLRGMIDRLDKDAAGNLRVVDYKSGATTYSKPDLVKGLALQTALYALAAERFWVRGVGRVVESYYLHIPIRKKSGELKFQGSVMEHELAETILQQAAFCITSIRKGIFPSAPAKPPFGAFSCRRWCDFASLCRVSRQSMSKSHHGGHV